MIRFPISRKISDLCKISDLLLFVSYFASQIRGIKFGNYFLVCPVQIQTFWLVDDRFSQQAIVHGNNYNCKILDLVLDRNYFSFSNPNQTHLP